MHVNFERRVLSYIIPTRVCTYSREYTHGIYVIVHACVYYSELNVLGYILVSNLCCEDAIGFNALVVKMLVLVYSGLCCEDAGY